MGIKTIIIAIVVLAVAGGGAYYVANNNKDEKQSDSSEAQPQDSNVQSNSINGLLAQDKNLNCTFDFTDDSGYKSSGNLYFASKRVRGDFNSTDSKGETRYSHMINDGKYQYFWEEGDDSGFKMNIDNIDSSEAQKDASKKETVDQNKEYNFDCSDWSVDESQFQPPSNVKFTDFSAQLQQAQQMQKNSESTRKKACAQISDSSARVVCENGSY